jgi:integrase
MLYLVAAYTGFRAGELASMTAKSFDLNADPPTLTVQANYSKRRRTDTQPLRPDLAEMLRDYLQEKVESDKEESGLVWPGAGGAMVQK